MEKNIDSIINKYMDQGYFPSAVCKIFSHDKTYYSKAFGNVDMDTIFDVASLTKIVTSTQVLMLVEEGLLDLNESLGIYLPIIDEFPVLKERLKDITIEELLTHNSGLIAWYPFYCHQGSVFEALNHALKDSEKVQGTLYSDLNYIILGELVKAVTGLSLEEALEKYIRDRLNIKNIFFGPSDLENVAPTAYGNDHEVNMCKDLNIEYNNWRSSDKALKGQVHDGNCHYYFGGVSGHAGIFAHVQAYVDLCRFYMTTTSDLLKSSMKEHRDGRGLGWQISESYPNGCGHSGFTGPSIYIDKDSKIGAVTFTNRVHTRGQAKDLFEFRNELHSVINKGWDQF